MALPGGSQQHLLSFARRDRRGQEGQDMVRAQLGLWSPLPLYDPALRCSWPGGPCRHEDPKESRGNGEGSGPRSPQLRQQPPIAPGTRSGLGSRVSHPAAEPRHPCPGTGGLVDAGTCSLWVMQ